MRQRKMNIFYKIFICDADIIANRKWLYYSSDKKWPPTTSRYNARLPGLNSSTLVTTTSRNIREDAAKYPILPLKKRRHM